MTMILGSAVMVVIGVVWFRHIAKDLQDDNDEDFIRTNRNGVGYRNLDRDGVIRPVRTYVIGDEHLEPNNKEKGRLL